MTEDTRAEAEKLSRTEGSGKSAIAELDKWAVREKERDELYRRDVQSAEADRLSAVAERDFFRKHNERSFELQDLREARDERRDAVYLAEVKHVQAHREREVAAFERIADALEKLTAK
jgi:hypothetical protein